MRQSRSWAAAGACMVLVAARGPSLGAQTVTRIDSMPECARCWFDTATVAVLRSPSPALRISPGSRPSEVRGGYVVREPDPPGQLLRYAADGRYLGTLRRPGPVVGALGLASAVTVDRNDSIHVFGRTHTVFDPNGRFARSGEVLGGAIIHEARSFGDGTMLVQAMVATPGRIGLPLHIVASDGSVVRSLGQERDRPFLDGYAGARRRIAVDSAGRIWSADLNRYRLIEWSADGGARRIVIRDASWFAPWDDGLAMPSFLSTRPLPQVMAIVPGADGEWWVLAWVADAQWRPWRPPAESLAPGALIERRHRAVDSIVELVDVARGRVVHSQRFDLAFSDLLGPGLLAAPIACDSAEVAVRLVRASVTRNPMSAPPD